VPIECAAGTLVLLHGANVHYRCGCLRCACAAVVVCSACLHGTPQRSAHSTHSIADTPCDATPAPRMHARTRAAPRTRRQCRATPGRCTSLSRHPGPCGPQTTGRSGRRTTPGCRCLRTGSRRAREAPSALQHACVLRRRAQRRRGCRAATRLPRRC
jgi:hypothetical protein